MPIEHWMTFATFSEQEFFTYPQPTAYHGVVLNANMVAHAPAGMAAFLLSKVNPSSNYLIDPMTHAFQHNPETISNEKGPKSSIRKLAGCYGAFVGEHLGVRPLSPEVVMDNLELFTRNVIDFQWDHLETHFKGNGDSKYLDEDEVVRRPDIVVAPYFFLTEDGLSRWLPVMARAAEAAVAYSSTFSPSPKVYSALVIDRAVLQVKELRVQTHEALNSRGLDGILLWIDDFDEVTASSLELAGLADLCGLFRGSGLDVLNLHGGYFSCMLGSNEFGGRFTGVSHGPEFGESRAVVPVGGGIPISRFYVPDLHLRAKFRDFLPTALANGWLDSAASFHREICDCVACQELIAGQVENFSLYGESDVKSIQRKHGVVRIEFPTTAAKKRCLKHYLNRKCAEYNFASTANRVAILDDLLRAHEKFFGIDEHPVGSHLLKWKRVLESV